MNDLQKCLSAFAVATWIDRLEGITLADKAIDHYLEPHIERGTALNALKELIQAFQNVRRDDVVSNAIRIDLDGRVRRCSELSPVESRRRRVPMDSESRKSL